MVALLSGVWRLTIKVETFPFKTPWLGITPCASCSWETSHLRFGAIRDYLRYLPTVSFERGGTLVQGATSERNNMEQWTQECSTAEQGKIWRKIRNNKKCAGIFKRLGAGKTMGDERALVQKKLRNDRATQEAMRCTWKAARPIARLRWQ